jgi:eukaryotic-like serine/threonine-protein kinase
VTAILERLSAALADRYRLERELGQGGMATVYLAQDLRHDRQVAIKVLRPELAAVLGADRFVQEIKTTAALQHPHILPLFDSGSADGFLYYVMPYVEGETLRTKLDREKQLGIEEAVKITTEVADALDYAHRHGVIHRDIKPENILLHDGRPMVADFGIALAVSAAAGGRMTETGMSLGTPHYMSPEQATADRAITGRSDIYSLASVLYEMLAGEPPHLGNSAQQIIMKIIADVPRPVSDLRKSVPPVVAASLARALEKLPADRFATAREFADALQGRGPASATLAATGMRQGAARTRLSRQPLVLGLAATLLAALAFAVLEWRAARSATPVQTVRFHVDASSSARLASLATGSNVAVSGDGTMLAFIVVEESGVPRVHVRRLDDGEARPIGGTDGAQAVCFAPDGRWIAYIRGSEVWKVRVDGGPSARVGSIDVSPIGMAWTGSGTIVVGSSHGLSALSAEGGRARTVARPDTASGERYFENPVILADDETVLFAIQTTGGISNTHLAALSLRGGPVRRFDVDALQPLGYLDGAVVLVSPSGALTAVRLDLATGRSTGDPVALGPEVLSSASSGTAAAALSPVGTLIYQSSDAQRTLAWVDAAGHFKALFNEPQHYAFPRLSPDGRRIAYVISTGPRSDVWVADTSGAAPTRLPSAGVLNDRPEWSPDGRRVLYRRERDGRSAIVWQPFDLTGSTETLLASDAHDFFEAVLSPDGRQVVYQVDDGGTQAANVMYRALAGDTTARPVAASRAVEIEPRLSPDGRWVAFVSDERGAAQVFVQPFPGPGTRVQVSVAGGQEPVWSRDGRRLFYRDGRHLVAASVSTSGGLRVTSRNDLIADIYSFAEAPHANYDVSADGRFLMVKGGTEAKLTVVYGWQRELAAQLRQEGPR